MAKNKSIEEQVEDKAKMWLNKYRLKTYTKTQGINPEINAAMKKAPSKSGGSGGNYPDIRLLLTTKTMKPYLIMIEVKGTKGKLVKLNAKGEIENTTAKGEPNYSNINGYAVNGAVHYANAIIDFTESYKDIIAIGINGYEEVDGTLKIEIGVYYVSANNLGVAKKVDEFSDLSFLAQSNFDAFIKKVEQLKLSPEELEAQSRKIEVKIESSLKSLNQSMQDDLNISVGSRVELITGMIMAGLGVPDVMKPLGISELTGGTGRKTNDGQVIINKISDFLTERKLPEEKNDMIINDLSRVFIHSGLYNSENGESKLKTIYARVKEEILPIFTSSYHLDFTGKLFNVLNEWVDIPDSDKNDVVLTPRYVTMMMAKLAKVDRNSFVWDYAVGSAGFLISSMKLMIEDAESNIKSPSELARKISNIKFKQLLGIEKRSDIYLLAVLNMLLMNDGATNILHKDSLKEFSGNYEQGTEKNKPFPANVFLLNPPYSADGKGFIFVKKALERMSSGRAAILIQENAGSGNGLPYTKELLQKNTLLASIHMADIFCGKAGVQTAVYVFEIGRAHNKKQIVKFINMSNDGYSRQNRKKSRLDVNLRDIDHANERYQEVVDLVNYGNKYLKYFTKEEYIEDTITLDGNDWTFSQHKKINTIPTEADYMKVVSDYLAWEVGQILRNELQLMQTTKKVKYNEFRIGDLFEKLDLRFRKNKFDKINDVSKIWSSEFNLPLVNAKHGDNGVMYYGRACDFDSAEMTIDIVGDGAVSTGDVYPQPNKTGVLYNAYLIRPLWDNPIREHLMFFTAVIQKTIKHQFGYDNKAGWNKVKELMIHLPVTANGNPDYDYMTRFIRIQQKLAIKKVVEWKDRELKT